jgi:hypothetical protein
VNSERSQAYGRVVRRLERLPPGKLQPAELRIVRQAADALFFCENLASDPLALEARAALDSLSTRLVDSDRLLPEEVEALSLDLEGCGPLASVH